MVLVAFALFSYFFNHGWLCVEKWGDVVKKEQLTERQKFLAKTVGPALQNQLKN